MYNATKTEPHFNSLEIDYLFIIHLILNIFSINSVETKYTTL